MSLRTQHCILVLLTFSCSAFSKTPENIDIATAKEMISNQSFKIIENKGQIADMNGQLAPFVLFEVSTPNLDLFITEQGITYVFKEIKKTALQENNSRSRVDFKKLIDTITANKHNVKWERIDIILSNATISKEQVIKEPFQTSVDKHFFYPHCPQGIYGVQEYEKIIIKEVYPEPFTP